MKTPVFFFLSKVWISRLLNLLLWLIFCVMSGIGLLLAFRLPPGSRGGQGLEALGFSRHEWGELHTWLGYGFIILILVHLAMHWRWLWQAGAGRRSWPIWAGLGGGLVLMLLLVLQPVQRNGRHEQKKERAEISGSRNQP